jgi:hypothetical protein
MTRHEPASSDSPARTDFRARRRIPNSGQKAQTKIAQKGIAYGYTNGRGMRNPRPAYSSAPYSARSASVGLIFEA